jgi:hypothetical protein
MTKKTLSDLRLRVFGYAMKPMARTSPPPVFPTWRDLWASLDGIPELLTATDAALRRRAAGNHRIPRWTIAKEDGKDFAIAVKALEAWAGGKPPQDRSKRPQMIRGIQSLVGPALAAVAWPRWLLLERAFLDASVSGDLLFAALVLRTMSEEVMRLHALNMDTDTLATLAKSTADADQNRLTQYLSFAWTSLATLPTDMVMEGAGWPSLSSVAKRMPRLEQARAALNSYVHPNYGSHIAALCPERAAAARLLLEAVAAVYETFFALSWSEKQVTGPTLPLGVRSFEPWKRTSRRLLSHTLPEIHRTAGNDALAEVVNAPAITEWLTAESDVASAMVRDPAAALMVADMPRRAVATRNASDLEFRIWEGARAADVAGVAAARRAELKVVSEFPNGAPDTTDDVRWLRFNAFSLQLAMLIDQAKAAAFKVQLVRQIVQGNSLAAYLCVRSLIEHRALAVWLPDQVGASLDAVASLAQATATLPQAAGQAETALGSFLAGQGRKTKEEQRAWIMTEQGGVRLAWLNLGNVVETVFPRDDRFHKLYALSSGVMHGRSCRGIDLLLRPADTTISARSIGILVLERLSNWDEELDHLSAAFVASDRMKHAAAFGGAAAATADSVAQQMFGHFKEAFVPGVDYSGGGTPGAPFELGPHLEYYQASRALLAQLGVNHSSATRVLVEDISGHLCDRWYGPDREYWFKAPIHRVGAGS